MIGNDALTLPFDDGRTIQERFEAFHRDNPHVYRLLRGGALRLVGRGWKHYGIGALWEGIRYMRALETVSLDDYKLNNDYRSRYARMLMEREAELTDFFEVRELRTP